MSSGIRLLQLPFIRHSNRRNHNFQWSFFLPLLVSRFSILVRDFFCKRGRLAIHACLSAEQTAWRWDKFQTGNATAWEAVAEVSNLSALSTHRRRRHHVTTRSFPVAPFSAHWASFWWETSVYLRWYKTFWTDFCTNPIRMSQALSASVKTSIRLLRLRRLTPKHSAAAGHSHNKTFTDPKPKTSTETQIISGKNQPIMLLSLVNTKKPVKETITHKQYRRNL